ncbi:TRL domain-containing protein, partial [Salinibacter sp.]
AATDGEISNIHHVDFKTRSILGLYVKYTTVVYGR